MDIEAIAQGIIVAWLVSGKMAGNKLVFDQNGLASGTNMNLTVSP